MSREFYNRRKQLNYTGTLLKRSKITTAAFARKIKDFENPVSHARRLTESNYAERHEGLLRIYIVYAVHHTRRDSANVYIYIVVPLIREGRRALCEIFPLSLPVLFSGFTLLRVLFIYIGIKRGGEDFRLEINAIEGCELEFPFSLRCINVLFDIAPLLVTSFSSKREIELVF